MSRLILVLLLAASLTALPVLAEAAMMRATQAEMSMSGPDDGCASCKSVQIDRCSQACCQMQALTVEALTLAKPLPERFVVPATERAASLLRRPDPPPPRS